MSRTVDCCRQEVLDGLTCLMASTIFASEHEDEWKLRPLCYNNPGLKVDLGVGLWAWPLPMDFDRDGDLDLGGPVCPESPEHRVRVRERGDLLGPRRRLPHRGGRAARDRCGCNGSMRSGRRYTGRPTE